MDISLSSFVVEWSERVCWRRSYRCSNRQPRWNREYSDYFFHCNYQRRPSV